MGPTLVRWGWTSLQWAATVLTVRCWLALVFALTLQSCEGPASKLLGPRAERRMSANQLFNLSVQKLREGDFSSCARVLRRVLERKRMVKAYANLAHCLRRQGPSAYASAEAVYISGLERAPQSARLHYGRGVLFVLTGQTSSAAATLQTLRALDGARARALEAVIAGKPPEPEDLFEEMATPRQAPLGIFGN